MSRVSGLAERVRLMVLRGEIPAGERIVELHVAETFRVSRATVREVLRQLEGNGLLEANESGGMRVVRLDPDELVATLQVRAALEALSARLAAGRVRDGHTTPPALDELSALAGAAEVAMRTAAPGSAVLADRNFHRAVGALAANGACRDALDRIWDQIVVARSQSVARQQRVELVDGEHRDLLDAIATGDQDEASTLARRHVLATLA